MDWYSRKVLAWRLSNSTDSKGAWRDNRMIERLWRSLKYECVYLHAFEKGSEAKAGTGKWLAYYNVERPHSTHRILTPDEAYASKTKPMRIAAGNETLIHLNKAVKWSKTWGHLYMRMRRLAVCLIYA